MAEKIMNHSYESQNCIYGDELFTIKEKQLLQSKVHRSIGAISFINPSGIEQWGSGILISKDIVLTAANCVYNQTYKLRNRHFKFYLDACGQVSRELEVQSVFLDPYLRYSQTFETYKVFALLKLKRPAIQSPNQDQFLPLTALCENCIQGFKQEIEIYGFPNQLNLKTQNKFALYQQGISSCDILQQINFGKRSIVYRMSSKTGQNGCPIIANDNIIGIHLGVKNKKQFNVGELISSYLISQIKSNCEILKGDNPAIQECEHEYQKQKTNTHAKELNQQGKQHFVYYRYQQALLCFNKRLDILTSIRKLNPIKIYSTQYTIEEAITLKWIGHSHYRLDNYHQASYYLKQSKKNLRRNVADSNYSQVCYWLGMTEKKMGNFRESSYAFYDSLKSLEQYEQYREKIVGKQYVTSQCVKELVDCLRKLDDLSQFEQVIMKYKLDIEL